MSLTIPSWVTPGGHTLQFVGYQSPYTSIALSTGITVNALARASAGAAVSCTATHPQPATAAGRALWAQRKNGITGATSLATRVAAPSQTCRMADEG